MKRGLIMGLLAGAIIGTDQRKHFGYPESSPNWKAPEKPLPKGTKVYNYPEGFSCVAISQKSADKKYKKWRAKQDNREFPCESCDTGEYFQIGTDPAGICRYECDDCGDRVSYP